MELWFSGEISEDVDKPFQSVSNDLERKINKLIGKKSYGEGLSSWDVIALIAGSEWPQTAEVRKYSKRSKECEYRVRADHAAFLKGPRKAQIRILFQLLRGTVEDLAAKDIRDFDVESLLKDLDLLAKKNKW